MLISKLKIIFSYESKGKMRYFQIDFYTHKKFRQFHFMAVLCVSFDVEKILSKVSNKLHRKWVKVWYEYT